MSSVKSFEAWDRLARYMRMRPLPQSEPSIAGAVDPEAMPDQERLYADLLEEKLNKNNLTLGIKKEKRKIIIDIIPEGDDGNEFQPITAWAALAYKQGAWLKQYFRLHEHMQVQTLH